METSPSEKILWSRNEVINVVQARLRVLFLASLVTVLTACRPAEKEKISSPQIAPFELGDVRLLPGPFEEARRRNLGYLLEADVDRLLHMFRVTAGLPSSAEPLGEWESPDIEVRGHTLGHYLTACALVFASTGDEELKARADRIVGELALCQNAIGNGYVSAFPETFFDRLEAGEKVWAPWYMIHKTMAGLLDVHLRTGNRQALEVLEGMAVWVGNRTGRLTFDEMQKTLETEFGGMNEIFYNLYALSGNPEHLDLAERFNHEKIIRPLVNHQDHLKGLHANTTIPKIVGLARGFELTGIQELRTASEFFWREVVDARAYVTGGTSNYEHWRSEPGIFATELSEPAHESCCTYNMLKLTRHLFSWTGDVRYADYYERALFNGILSTQNPRDGSFMYFVPMSSGMWKPFMKPWNTFLCCNGTGIESFAKLQDSIYFHNVDGIYINLFIASEVDWRDKGFRLRQETAFPEQEGSTFLVRVEKPVELALHIRMPSWLKSDAVVHVNDTTVESPSSPGRFVTLRRTWNDGDRIVVELPMGLRLERLPDDDKTAAVLYGPIVLAGELGTEGMTDAMKAGFKEPETNLMWLRDVTSLYHSPSVEPPQFVVNDENPEAWIRPVEGESLAFETHGVGRPSDVKLVPFYKLFGERYAIYWNLLSEEEWRERAAGARLPDGVIDQIKINDPWSERRHNFQAFEFERGTGESGDWVQSSFWLKVDLSVAPDRKVRLRCSYSTDTEAEFDVMIDGEPLATEHFQTSGDLVEAEYPIPPEMIKGKTRVSAMFEAHPEKSTGRLVGCSVQ